MTRFIFDLAIFAALCFVPSLSELGDDRFPLSQQPAANEDTLFCNSKNAFRLILNPDNVIGPCDFFIPLCGIQTCTCKIKGSADKLQNSSKSLDTGSDEYCFHSNNEKEFFIEQQLMNQAAHHFVKCRVQDDSENKAVLCDWKLFNTITVSDEFDESFGSVDCKCRNNCLMACQLEIYNPLLESTSEILVIAGAMGVLTITSVVFFLIFSFCTRDSNTHYSPEDTNIDPETCQSSMENKEYNESNMRADSKKKPDGEIYVTEDYNTKINGISIIEELHDSCKKILPQMDYVAICKFCGEQQLLNKVNEKTRVSCGYCDDWNNPPTGV